MTRRKLRSALGFAPRFDAFFGGAALLVLGAGLLPACGGGGGGGHGGAGGSGSGGAGGAPVVGACGFLDVTEPNETRDTATPYVLNAPLNGCIGSQADVDEYSFTAPATDLAGGYVLLSFTAVDTTGSLDVVLFSAADNSMIKNIYSGTEGASLYGYLAVAPGATYRIQVKPFAAQGPVRYTMLATYVALADAYEPNDTKDTAKPIPLGTPITAFQSTGYIGAPYDGAAFADWYSVPLVAGTFTVKMTNVPTDIRGEVFLFDPEGEQLDDAYSPDPGANVTSMSAPAATAGTYKLRVVPFAGGPVASDMMLPAAPPPDHFTRPYTLTVTQP